MIHALHFIARKLGLEPFAVILNGPIVSSWLSAQKWARRAPSEALPLPLYTVCQLELAVLACEEPVDSFLMGCFLTSLLCYGQGSGFRMHSAWICLLSLSLTVPFADGAGGVSPAHLVSRGDAWSRGPLAIAGLPASPQSSSRSTRTIPSVTIF